MSKKQTRRTYTTKFKLDVVNQSENCDNISKLANDLGLHRQLIYRWRAEHKSDPARSFLGNGVEKQTPDEEKIAWLQRKLHDVKTQRDILKNAMGIFANHQIIGWSLADSMAAEELLFRSDQGVQYACTDFTEEQQDCKVTQSMSRRGNCWDNAPAESFFKTLKAKLPTDTSGCSYGQALFRYIDIWYNRKRLHSSLDYQTPAQIEYHLTHQPVAA